MIESLLGGTDAATFYVFYNIIHVSNGNDEGFSFNADVIGVFSDHNCVEIVASVNAGGVAFAVDGVRSPKHDVPP